MLDLLAVTLLWAGTPVFLRVWVGGGLALPPLREVRMARKKERRRPTYGAATRLVRMLHGLLDRPYGWSFEAIQDELAISERTLLRYLSACRSELTDGNGKPVFEVFRRGPRRMLRLPSGLAGPDSSAYELLFLYFALTVLRFLDGTVVKDGVEGLWDRLQRNLPAPQRVRLQDFDRKFYTIESGVKDYRERDDLLDEIVRCLVDQRRVQVDYAGLLGEGHVHEFDPYTLLMYRGGLYLIGYSRLYKKIIYLAIERIRSLTRLEVRFDYPKGYSPQKYTDGVFGIVDGPETEVVLQLLNPETAAYLSVRRLHRSQKFRKRRDGTTELTLKVRGTAELVHWILGFGPFVKVLRPPALRREIRQALTQAAELYA